MYYVIDGNSITFECEKLKLYQPIDPSTGNPFKGRSEQVKWVEDFIKGYYTTDKATISFCDENGNDIKSLYVGSPFKLKVEVNINHSFTINATIMTDSGFSKDVELNFEDGVANADLELSKSDKYYIQFNECITIEDSTVCLVHEQHEYMMYIGN